MDDPQPTIDADLVRRLVDAQFPQWRDLPVSPVEFGGWDNRTFHLGDEMMVRLPSAAHYSLKGSSIISFGSGSHMCIPSSVPTFFM
jgi:aminoglycoside phosphotransferase (APT) family kinase protein